MWLYMMLADIKSEHGGVFTIEYLIPNACPPWVPVGHQGAGCRLVCHLHLEVLSISGGEFSLAKRGCQLRQPHNLCAMLS